MKVGKKNKFNLTQDSDKSAVGNQVCEGIFFSLDISFWERKVYFILHVFMLTKGVKHICTHSHTHAHTHTTVHISVGTSTHTERERREAVFVHVQCTLLLTVDVTQWPPPPNRGLLLLGSATRPHHNCHSCRLRVLLLSHCSPHWN